MSPRSRAPSWLATAKAGAPDLGEDCPNATRHTYSPAGYVEASSWANRMMHTHIQRKCDGCDRWLIWVPLAEATTAERAEWRRDVKPNLVPVEQDTKAAHDETSNNDSAQWKEDTP